MLILIFSFYLLKCIKLSMDRVVEEQLLINQKLRIFKQNQKYKLTLVKLKYLKQIFYNCLAISKV